MASAPVHPEQQPGCEAGTPMASLGVIAQQTKLLAAKNVKLHVRSHVSTATQLCIGIVFLVLVRLMEVAINMNVNIKAQDVASPSTAALGALRPCDATARGGAGACYVLAYAPDAASGGALGDYAEEIVADVLADASLPAIGAAGGAIGFASASEMREWLYDHPAAVDVGVVFRDAPGDDDGVGGSRVAYSLQANWTLQCATLKYLECNDPKRDVALPAQLALDSAVLRKATGDAGARIDVSAGEFPHPFIVREEIWDVVRSYAPSFLYIVLMFNFVLQLQASARARRARARRARACRTRARRRRARVGRRFARRYVARRG